MAEPMTIFNRHAVGQHRQRAVSSLSSLPRASLPRADFLLREVATRLLDRLSDVTAVFPVTLDLGCRSGLIGELAEEPVDSPASENTRQKAGIRFLMGGDLTTTAPASKAYQGYAVMDEETLPFAHGSLDMVISNLSLHWVNDLPGTMSQIRRALRPDGLFLATMFGGETLTELRSAFGDAEIAVEGGLSPRVSPFTDIRDAGALLQRAGFALPVVDTETIRVSYGDPLKLMHDLRAMGETNAVLERRNTFTRRETLMTALDLYRERFSDTDGRVTATFQILYLSAWAPAPGQQKPLKPGQGEVSLKDFLTSK